MTKPCPHCNGSGYALSEVIVIVKGDNTYHDGPGWYYYDAEYPDEGVCGAFKTKEEAREHAMGLADVCPFCSE